MLSGYSLPFDMPHLSVEMLIPGMFLATRTPTSPAKRAIFNVTLSAAVTFLCIVGGMPESAFLILAFACAYFLFRLAAGPHTRAVVVTYRLKYFFFAQGLGLALAAFLLDAVSRVHEAFSSTRINR